MKLEFNQQIEKLRIAFQPLPWSNREFYREFLTQTFYFVQHSTRLVALASANAKLSENSLHRRFATHISEEKGHDLLALSDLKKLGHQDLSEELIETQNLYEPQYYKIERQSASALFGYILALEGVASLIFPEFIGRIYQAHGEDCSRFLKLHVEEDPDHVDKALAEIAKLTPQEQDIISKNMNQSFRNYSYFLKAIENQIS